MSRMSVTHRLFSRLLQRPRLLIVRISSVLSLRQRFVLLFAALHLLLTIVDLRRRVTGADIIVQITLFDSSLLLLLLCFGRIITVIVVVRSIFRWFRVGGRLVALSWRFTGIWIQKLRVTGRTTGLRRLVSVVRLNSVGLVGLGVGILAIGISAVSSVVALLISLVIFRLRWSLRFSWLHLCNFD
jgi:hypothetical protein